MSRTIAKLGSWHDLITNDWSKGHYEIFELENCQQISSMLLPGQIHPDDRSILDEADKIVMETAGL
jgi:hypothetical protein